MKRILGVTIAVLAIAAIPGSHLLWGKGHVPVHKAQVCHRGRVIVVAEAAVQGHQVHGDCQLPACDFNNIFQSGQSCDFEDSGDGTCALPNPRNEASTPACPAGKF